MPVEQADVQPVENGFKELILLMSSFLLFNFSSFKSDLSLVLTLGLNVTRELCLKWAGVREFTEK